MHPSTSVCVFNYGPSMYGQTITLNLHGEAPSRLILCLNNNPLLLWVSPSLGKQEREYSQENRCNMQHATGKHLLPTFNIITVR